MLTLSLPCIEWRCTLDADGYSMTLLCHYLSRCRLFAFLGVVVLLLGLMMLDPYPRQMLFGPTIRGKPWCVWESAVRRDFNRAEYEKSLKARIMRWLGIASGDM